MISTPIIVSTPVRTGSARASWNASKGRPVARNVTIGVGGGANSRNQVTAVANSLTLRDKFYLSNGKPYIRRLEYEGWSNQAVGGMVRANTPKWPAIGAAAARQVLEVY